MADSETATFGGGCFWCMEPIFEDLRGVISAEPGFAGGRVKNPSYREVCTGRTGHAEVVQITFDPERISFRDLLEVFFAVHDPTTENRQGADVGPQYRSIILTHSDGQREEAFEMVSSLEAEPTWEGRRIVTEIVPFEAFYPAEKEHRHYFEAHPERAYCRTVIAPKVAKFHRQFSERIGGVG